VPDFNYEALSATGERSQGSLAANNEREALSMLDARGLYPIRIHAAQSKARFSFGKVSGRHMATFYSQLADLLHAGVPLLRSLDILERQGNNPLLQQAVREVRAEVAEGTGLAQAMAKHPRVFNELAVSMVRAGQEGGFLEDVLIRIADFTEHQEDLKSKVVGAMAYPVFLSFAGAGILTILMVFFVPKFEPIFKKLEDAGAMPTLTLLVMGLSHFTGRWVLWVVLAMVAMFGMMILDRLTSIGSGIKIMVRLFVLGGWIIAVLMKGMMGGHLVEALFLMALMGGMFAIRQWLSTEKGRLVADRLRLRVPGAGKIFLSLALSRFTRILGTLLLNGIPILRALQIAKDSTGNRVLSNAIAQSAENVTAGEKLATPLRACKYFPHDVVEMVAVAEESNTLETVLIKISDSLEKRTARQLELFVRLLEPLMLLVMAAIVGVVVAGLLLPIFKMGSLIHSGQ
jgi:general secretion pathway protein F/type IV pilus assembly protein PilC